MSTKNTYLECMARRKMPDLSVNCCRRDKRRGGCVWTKTSSSKAWQPKKTFHTREVESALLHSLRLKSRKRRIKKRFAKNFKVVFAKKLKNLLTTRSKRKKIKRRSKTLNLECLALTSTRTYSSWSSSIILTCWKPWATLQSTGRILGAVLWHSSWPAAKASLVVC